MNTDSEMLRRYAEHGDEAAFTEVVRRQTDFVHSAAWRITRNAALAQDVTQAVFTKLAREAEKVGGLETILGWLHTQARHRAMDAVRSEERRRTREQEAWTMQNISSEPDANWEKIRLLVDEAAGRLRERDRQAVLLRFFKGLSYPEVGATLGLSENSAKKRVDRALEKMRGNFARRGVAVSPAGLASAIAAHSVEAAPVGLAEKVAVASLAGSGAAAAGGFWLWTLLMSTKTKIILATAIVVALAAGVAIEWRGASQPVIAASSASASSPVVVVPPEPMTARATGPTPIHVQTPVAATTTPTVVTDTSAAPAASADTFVAEPQTDLKSAIATGIHFLEANDLASTMKTLDSPGMIKSRMESGLGQTAEEMAAKIRELQPDTDALLADQLALFRAVQDMTPEISPDGKFATFRLDQPIGSYHDASFVKVNGYWYFGLGSQDDVNAPAEAPEPANTTP